MTTALKVSRPAEAGGPWEITDKLTIFEAAVLYGDGYPLEDVVASVSWQGRMPVENAHGLGPRHTWMGETPWNPAPRDVYLHLIALVAKGDLKPLKAAFDDAGEIDPLRTVILLRELLELAKARGDAGSNITGMLNKTADGWDGSPRRRRPSGRNYSDSDRPLIEEMRLLVDAGEASSPWDAALSVSGRAEGSLNTESKAKRLMRRYSATFRAERGGED